MGPRAMLQAGPITDDLLQQIFASDQDMYPAPLTYARLQSWVDACPGLSQCFYLPEPDAAHRSRGAELAGAIIVLPLKEAYWRALLTGNLRETDIDVSASFPANDSAENTMGLHVFHIERFSSRAKGFTSISLAYAQGVADTKGWDVLGYSALTATPEGAKTFERLGFELTGYEELWVETDGQVVLKPVFPGSSPQSAEAEHQKASVKGQARMTAKYLNREKRSMSER